VLRVAARVEASDEVRFGVIATGQSLDRTEEHVTLDVGIMEWHGNPVGDRWLLAHATSCRACDGFRIGALDLLDGHIFRAVVWPAPLPRAPATRADTQCAEIRAQLVAADARVAAGECTCGAYPPADEISGWALPQWPDLAAGTCDPAVESGFSFTMTLPTAVDDIPRVTGAVAVARADVTVQIWLYGQHYRRLLDAKRALNAHSPPFP